MPKCTGIARQLCHPLDLYRWAGIHSEKMHALADSAQNYEHGRAQIDTRQVKCDNKDNNNSNYYWMIGGEP